MGISQINVTAIANGQKVFAGDMCCIPRQGEYVNVEGYTYVVERVTYTIKGGINYSQEVILSLRYIG